MCWLSFEQSHIQSFHYAARSLRQVKEIIGIKLTSSRSWPRGTSYFFLDKKVTKKSSQQGGFFALSQPDAPRSAFALQNEQNHGCNYFAPLHTQCPTLLQKLAMPFLSLKATIVLPDFTRSFPADGKRAFCAAVKQKGSTCG